MNAEYKQEKFKPSVIVTLVLAWMIPGAGHVYLGHVGKGVIIFLCIAATFWAGIAVGGVMTVDYYFEPWWFTAQMMCGVHSLTGWYRQQKVYKDFLASDHAMHADITSIQKSAGGRVTFQQQKIDEYLAEKGIALVVPAETAARTYSGVAGLLNFMCIFDAVMLAIAAGAAGRKTGRETDGAKQDGSAESC
ncbi:MAG: hypothetical protein HZA50_04570 [Planctomycetes bacterium]|nr:hypothetical protein [Planctomycetota bacterium]